VTAAAAQHPSLLSVPADIDPVTAPLSLAVGSADSLLDMKTVDSIKEILEKKKDVESEVKVYEDQVHGFALRGDFSSPKDKEAMDGAEKQAIDWFKKYLK
jgi:dienelactone hydrolase